MADHKQAIKRHRQSLLRAERNRHYRTGLKTAMKKAMDAGTADSPDKVKLVQEAIALVDKVRGKGIIPANRGSRYVSRLGKLLTK